MPAAQLSTAAKMLGSGRNSLISYTDFELQAIKGDQA
jgi:hypothetical protein